MRAYFIFLFILESMGVVGCFNPSLKQCAVTCNLGTTCPGGNVCLSDGFCHINSSDSLCSNGGSDGGVDASASDCGNGVTQANIGEDCDDSNTVDGDGCSSFCQEETGFVCVDQPSVCRPSPGRAGDLVITELMVDPATVLDDVGEWFEVFNATNTELDLRGLVVGSNNDQDISITVSMPMASGMHVVFGANGDPDKNGGVTVDFSYGNIIHLSNGNADHISLSIGGTLIDQVAWLAPTSGNSLSLSGDQYDSVSNDDSTNFCLGVDVYGAGDKGTPGQQNPICQ